MSYNAALIDLLEHVAQSDKPVLLSWQTVQSWPKGQLQQFKAVGLLVRAAQAESIECSGCENACMMDVLIHSNTSTLKNRAFIVCDDPDRQGEMGRITIPLPHLQQWKTSHKQLAKVVANVLGLEFKIDQTKQQANIRLGMLSSERGRRWVSLNANPLVLEVNQYTAPLDELLYFESETLGIDRARINEMLHTKPPAQGKQYTPSISQREAGKRKTEAMHQDWQDAYKRLCRQHTDKKATWISKRIATMSIAQGKTASTIYRKMKG